MANISFSQFDEDNYTTIMSSGLIPTDFTEFTYNKLAVDMESDRNDMTSTQKTEFYTGINYAIDGLLHSGLVIYGDPISEYIKDVAGKLLKDDVALFEELRFYTIKSNATNAFATDQGIVFVTTGLLSQITCEAQLALVLSHEISHYTEKHALESYQFIQENRRSSIEHLSIYSKDLELTADKLGLELYAKAGYAKDAVIPTFDVLLYSYLPFDEVPIPNSYFQDFDSLLIPDFLFPTEEYEINAIDNEDDSRSTHPNIKNRKEKIQTNIDEIKSWGSDLYKFGEERFDLIQTIARFEVVRNNLQDAEYGKALYTIYLLERDYPTSLFLKRAKAQSWLGILQYRLDLSVYDVIDSKSESEGASAKVHHFIRELNSSQLTSVAIRNVASIAQENPEDQEISAIYNHMIQALAGSSKFDIDDYAIISFQTAWDRKIEEIANQNANSNDTVVEQSTEKLSKYDRIKKKKKNVNVPVHLDSTDFHLYLIPDVVSDKYFLSTYTKFKDQKKNKTIDSKKSRRSIVSANEEPIDHVIVIQPFLSYQRNNEELLIKGEKLGQKFRKGIDIAGEEAGVKITHLDRTAIIENGTERFNQYCLLTSYLVQTTNNTDINAFPVDYQLTQKLMEDLGSKNIMYTAAIRDYDMNFNFAVFIGSVIFYPFFPVYISYLFADAPKNEIHMLMLDMESGNITGATDLKFKAKLRKYNFAAHTYNFLVYLNQNMKPTKEQN